MTAGTVPSRRVGATERRDRWWLAPLLTAIGLTAFGIYSLVAAAMGTDYVYDDYWAEHNIVVRKDVEGMRAEPRPVVKTAELAAMIEKRKAAERA